MSVALFGPPSAVDADLARAWSEAFNANIAERNRLSMVPGGITWVDSAENVIVPLEAERPADPDQLESRFAGLIWDDEEKK